MKQLISVVAVAVLVPSCSQKENKKNESEFKEREIALKEKELSKNDSVGKKRVVLKNEQDTVSKGTSELELVVPLPQKKESTIGQVTFLLQGKMLFYF